jgi:pimeloyl-ACP methyl ester carboxylesterase
LVRKLGRVVGLGVVLSLTGLLSLVGLLLFWSYPGKPRPFLDQHGQPLPDSLAEKIWVPINGVEQGMFILSKNSNNPVLLFVHGGPGMPEYWLTQRYPTGLEDLFTIVWWEQRGAGISYSPHMPAESLTVEQLIADTLAVSRYLGERFGQEKIYLLGHSWGSFLAIQAAARAPEQYHAYIGMGQVTYQLQSEQLAYAYALEQYQARGNLAMLRKLEAAPPTLSVPLPEAYVALRDAYMHELGIGTTHAMDSVITGIFLPSWQFREYSLAEKLNLWRGKRFSSSSALGLWNAMQATDLRQQVTELAIPAYFFHGRYDYTCAYELAQAYAAQLTAPRKGFYTFEQSAHSPIFEEPERARQILREDVLPGTNWLADEP